MPPRKRIFREDILKAAVHLVQQEGASALSVRNIAKELNCSTQPIYSQFESMETLRDELMAYIREQYLREAARGGGGRLALDAERLRMDFSLPARNGRGRPLTAGELQELLDRESPAVFFSQDLCARYFTYTRDGETHFVLFDDADTLRQKLRLGSSLGFSAAFLMYPEVRDLLPQLFPPPGKSPAG